MNHHTRTMTDFRFSFW